MLKLKFILTAQRQNFNFLKIGNGSSDEISRGASQPEQQESYLALQVGLQPIWLPLCSRACR